MLIDKWSVAVDVEWTEREREKKRNRIKSNVRIKTNVNCKSIDWIRFGHENTWDHSIERVSSTRAPYSISKLEIETHWKTRTKIDQDTHTKKIHSYKMNHRRNLQINCFTFGIIWLIGYANGEFSSHCVLSFFFFFVKQIWYYCYSSFVAGLFVSLFFLFYLFLLMIVHNIIH